MDSFGVKGHILIKDNSHYCIAVLETTVMRSRLAISLVMVSNAALRSNETTTETSPSSDAYRRSFVTLTVLFLCYDGNPDLNCYIDSEL